jgi:hypothetical protein
MRCATIRTRIVECDASPARDPTERRTIFAGRDSGNARFRFSRFRLPRFQFFRKRFRNSDPIRAPSRATRGNPRSRAIHDGSCARRRRVDESDDEMQYSPLVEFPSTRHCLGFAERKDLPGETLHLSSSDISSGRLDLITRDWSPEEISSGVLWLPRWRGDPRGNVLGSTAEIVHRVTWTIAMTSPLGHVRENSSRGAPCSFARRTAAR